MLDSAKILLFVSFEELVLDDAAVVFSEEVLVGLDAFPVGLELQNGFKELGAALFDADLFLAFDVEEWVELFKVARCESVAVGVLKIGRVEVWDLYEANS